MPYIIRNAVGEICGRCTSAPGLGNPLPDGNPEIVEFVEEDTPESEAFVAAQLAKIAQHRDPVAALKSALLSKGLLTQGDLAASASPVPAEPA